MKLRTLLILTFCMLLLAPVTSAGARDRSMFVMQQFYDPPTPPASSYGASFFKVDLDSGALADQQSLIDTGKMPTMPGITPDGTRLYTADWDAGAVHGYSIGVSGLTELVGSPWATGTNPNGLAIDPNGGALWTANYGGGSLGGFSIDGAGALSGLIGSPFSSVGTPNSLAVSPRVPFIYVAGSDDGGVDGFRRSATGELTQLAGFPLADGDYPIDVEFTVDGRFLFVADNASNEIVSYSIDQSSGALTPVGSPVAASSGPTGLSATADGKWLIVSLGGSQEAGSYEINNDGTLTHIGNVAVATAGGWAYPNDAITTPDSHFAYIANYWAGWIDGFAIGPDGQLTTLPDSPWAMLPWNERPGPPASFAIVPNQGPVAAFTDSVSGQTVDFNGSASSDPDGSVAQYAWDFGDGHTGSGASPQHTYAGPGSYTATLRVTDDENCSDEQIGTGQSLYCNGGAQGRAQHSVTIDAPSGPPGPPGPPPAPNDQFRLTNPSGKQAKTRRRGHKQVRRVRTRYTLSHKATVSFRFQKSRQGGTCRRGVRTAARHQIRFRNFGRRVAKPARLGKNQRTFSNRLGGRRITPGRYRVRMQAKDTNGRWSTIQTTKSFCVR